MKRQMRRRVQLVLGAAAGAPRRHTRCVVCTRFVRAGICCAFSRVSSNWLIFHFYGNRTRMLRLTWRGVECLLLLLLPPPPPRKQGKYYLAKPMYRACLEGRIKTLGALHIEKLSCKINIASLLAESKDRCIESELLFRETIRAGSMRYGADHPRLSSWKRSFRDRFGRDFVDGDGN